MIAATTAGVDIHRERVVLSARSFERMREYIAALGAPLRSLLGAHAQARASVSEVDTVRYNRLGGGDGGPMNDLCEETLTASVGAVALAVAIRTRAESITSPPRLRRLAVLASVFQSALIPVATRAASLGWRNLLAHVEDCQVLVDDDPTAACPVSGPAAMLFLTLSAYRGIMFATTVLFLAVRAAVARAAPGAQHRPPAPIRAPLPSSRSPRLCPPGRRRGLPESLLHVARGGEPHAVGAHARRRCAAHRRRAAPRRKCAAECGTPSRRAVPPSLLRCAHGERSES